MSRSHHQRRQQQAFELGNEVRELLVMPASKVVKTVFQVRSVVLAEEEMELVFQQHLCSHTVVLGEERGLWVYEEWVRPVAIVGNSVWAEEDVGEERWRVLLQGRLLDWVFAGLQWKQAGERKGCRAHSNHWDLAQLVLQETAINQY